MARFAKCFDVGDLQYLAYIEPDTDAVDDDQYVLHQLTDLGGAVLHMTMRGSEKAIRAVFDALDAPAAQRFMQLDIVQAVIVSFEGEASA